ncbi:hypothetical protein [Streptomyces sp. CC208A]|uniref:hypothetical protein n=1 Tax=Streptomyces sp. CC208A TaxID=3044573 RepID=UPI0024A80028|nr:hypothetical protein [Streptomyces sp. CC208A]
MSVFATEHKATPGYLDVAANANGAEKGLLMHRALQRVTSPRPHLVEIGPGGGAAVAYLAERLQMSDRSDHANDITLTLIEVPGVVSRSLTEAMNAFDRTGTCTLVEGFAQDIDTLLDRRADVIGASALLHEVYSYAGGYGGIHSLMRKIPRVLTGEGYFAYRDVYAVRAPSLHERVTHAYDGPSWLQFLRMFLPHYIREGTHPYHHAEDEVVARQGSRITPVDDLSRTTGAVIGAPVGLFREVQRHYITFRDHVWRSGVLGFVPVLDGQLAADWLDARTGHKRVRYVLTGSDWLPRSHKAMLLAVSEPYGDRYTVDGDIFDECTDVALTAFLTAAERGDTACLAIWEAWSTREGRETYAYLTLGELITAFAVNSATEESVLLPVEPEDVLVQQRNYYNRYLTKRLPNPLDDAKQLVLFRRIPFIDTETLGQAMTTVQGWCSKRNLTRVYRAINTGEGT